MNKLSNYLHRRLLPAVLTGVMAAAGLAAALAPQAVHARSVDPVVKKQQKNQIARDLLEELNAPGMKKKRWAGERRGQRRVQVIVLSDSPDREMTALRASIEDAGGVVQVSHPAFKALTVVLPVKAVRKVARLPDVVSI